MKLTYKDAGVDIQTGNKLVDKIKPLAARTHRAGILGGIGGFGALFELPITRYKQPVLVSSTDGVGTKLKLAIQLNSHETIGIDLVAMCANDIIVQGAEPLFFLDYFATGKLVLEKGEAILSGIARGCEIANVALVGGETAEMPGIYSNEDYDLAGFIVGIVDKDNLITGENISPGDILMALPSSGIHSNGYSLVRKIISEKKIDLNSPFEGDTLGRVLLTPTKIYVRAILELLKEVNIKGMAHITGGGLIENIPRMLPKFAVASIQRSSWEMPEIFKWLQANGNIEDSEMFTTFNCGVGMIICISPEDQKKAVYILQQLGEIAWNIGTIEASDKQKPSVNIL